MERVCRLCLNVTTDSFADLNSKLDMLKVIRLDTDASLTETPGICSQCSETLQQSFDFKILALNTENVLNNFSCKVATNAKLNLNTLLRNARCDIGKMESVCRYCLKNMEASVNLDRLDEDVFLKDMIDKCLPEFNLDRIEQPTICLVCMDNLQTLFNFMIECEDNEEKIKNYIFTKGSNSKGQVYLSDVVKFYDDVNGGDAEHLDRDSNLIEVKRIKVEGDDGPWSVILDKEVKEIDCKFNKNLMGNGRSKRFRKPTHPCKICKRKYQSAKTLQWHLKKTHKEEIPSYSCEYCDYTTFVKELLDKHNLKNVETSSYRCEKCHFKTHKRAKYYEHLSKHGDKFNLDCPKCPKKFNRQVYLDGHILLCHPELEGSIESKVYQCVCGFKTVHQSDWMPHSPCGNVVQYRCDQCRYSTTVEEFLAEHKSKGHLHRCDVCGMEFVRKWELTKHMRDHSTEQEEYLRLIGEIDKIMDKGA